MYSLEKVMGAFPRNQEDCLRVLLESFLLIFFHPAAITGSLMSDFKGGGWFRSRELQRAEKPHQKPPPHQMAPPSWLYHLNRGSSGRGMRWL